MPPLGTELIDREAVEVIRRWIAEADPFHQEGHPEEKGSKQ
jgi:hypothetical protein